MSDGAESRAHVSEDAGRVGDEHRRHASVASEAVARFAGAGPRRGPAAVPEILVISGMSGAGRTQVAKVLEDLDWFVIDNLPPALLGKVVDLAFAPGGSVRRIAVVADVRGREFFRELVSTIEQLRASEANLRVLFLEADDDTLVRRFEASRRLHPAAEIDPTGRTPADGVPVGGSGLLAGIRRERELLRELRGMADLVIDTTETNVHELRDRVVSEIGEPDEATLRVKVIAFGYKYGTPRDADLVMDVRFLPNPHWVDELRPYTGRDAPVRDYVLGQPAVGPFLERFQALLDIAVPGYVAEGKRYLTIAIGCTGGKHRSVAIADEIARYLGRTTELPVSVEHRDLGSE